MSKTTNRTEDQESSGFRIAMKVLGTLHRWLYRASGGKLGKIVLELNAANGSKRSA